MSPLCNGCRCNYSFSKFITKYWGISKINYCQFLIKKQLYSQYMGLVKNVKMYYLCKYIYPNYWVLKLKSMKIFKTVFILLFLICISAVQSFSQASLFEINDLSNTTIDSYSEEELVSFYNKLTSLNISEEKAYSLLKEKGLPESEILKLKTRMGGILLSPKNCTNETTMTPLSSVRS